ncbi:hypothetical protein Tco_0949975 [Tanacetum coccineum]
MDKGKGQTSGVDDEGFIEVKMKKPSGTSNSPKTNPFVGTNNASTSCYNKKSPSNKVSTGTKATTSGTQDGGQSSTLLVEKINVFEKQMLEGKLVLVVDDRNPLEKVDFQGERVVDDDYDPYDDDMLEGREIPDNIQTICDNLDI